MKLDISQLDYLFWVGTLAAEGLTLLKLRRRSSPPSLRGARLYLMVQIITSASLFISYHLLPAAVSYWSYLILTIGEAGAELGVAAGVFEDLRGRSHAFGSVKTWILCTSLVGAVIGLHEAIARPVELSRYDAILASLRQTFGFIRVTALIGVAAYGHLMASAWTRAAAFIWTGLAVYVGADFVCGEANLWRPALTGTLRHVPDIFFLATMLLWSTSIRARLVTSVAPATEAVEGDGVLEIESQ